MNPIRIYLIAPLIPALALSAFCQTPQPAPPLANLSAAHLSLSESLIQNGVATAHSGRVKSVIYGPEEEVLAFTLGNGMAVTIQPELGMRLQSSVTRGARIQVSGVQRMTKGQMSLVAQSITANGETFVAAAPRVDDGPGKANPGPAIAAGPTPPPPAGSPDPLHLAGRGPDMPLPPPAAAVPTPQQNKGTRHDELVGVATGRLIAALASQSLDQFLLEQRKATNAASPSGIVRTRYAR